MSMSGFDLSKKTVVVIGATAGLGKALSFGLAAAGANVIPSSRSADATGTMSQQLSALGVGTLNHTVDVADRSSITSLRDAVLASFGCVDVLINCAGQTARVPTLDCSEELWNQIFDTNLTGTLRCCQIFGETMLARGRGRIINIASLSTFVAFQEVAAYGASKAAVGALTRSLAVEWADRGVQVNAIAPGIFPTALNNALLNGPRGMELLARTPVGRFGNADELVSTAAYLACDASSFTTGQIITVDGGFLASGVNQ